LEFKARLPLESSAMFNIRFKPYRLLALAIISLVASWLSGCVSAQPVPSSPDLIVSAVSPNDVRTSGATGSLVRWGGTIASIENTADGLSVLEIVSRPLYSGGRPIHNDQSAGRFIAETADFLDPEIVKAGRDMTLVGTVSEVREGKVGDANYRFPVVSIDTYRYWKPQSSASVQQRHHWNEFGPHRHDSFWDDWPFTPHRHPSHNRSGVSGSLNIILR
jgi:outer membrane lipoprotein